MATLGATLEQKIMYLEKIAFLADNIINKIYLYMISLNTCTNLKSFHDIDQLYPLYVQCALSAQLHEFDRQESSIQALPYQLGPKRYLQNIRSNSYDIYYKIRFYEQWLKRFKVNCTCNLVRTKARGYTMS